MAALATTKPKGGDWSYTGHYYGNSVQLGSYTRRLYTRTCSSALGGCTAWTVTPDSVGASADGYMLGVFGTDGALGLGFRSHTVNRQTVDAGTARYECISAYRGLGRGAQPDNSTMTMDVGRASTCANQNGPSARYATQVADHCMKAFDKTTSRIDFGGGAYTSDERAIVIEATY